MSIVHRLTGVALSVGTLLLVYWLVSAGAGADAFANAQEFVGSFIGRLLLFGWTWALFYHLCNGIRHLGWDIGFGFELDMLAKSGIAVVAVSGGLTVLAWILGYAV